MQKDSELFDIKPMWRDITINGEKLLVEYDYRAYAMIEEASGKSVYELKDDFLNGSVTLTNQLLVLYCGLLKHQKDFSFDTLKSYPHLGNLITQSLSAILEAFFIPLLPPLAARESGDSTNC